MPGEAQSLIALGFTQLTDHSRAVSGQSVWRTTGPKSLTPRRLLSGSVMPTKIRETGVEGPEPAGELLKMPAGRRPTRRAGRTLVQLLPAVLLLLLGGPGVATAKCPYKYVEVRGQVLASGERPIEGAEVLVFVDETPHAILDLRTGATSWRTDSEGFFVARGGFVDLAWPRWWHRFDVVFDRCGRDPESFTIVVVAEAFQPQQIVVHGSDERVDVAADGSIVIDLRSPLRLMSRHGGVP